jgi:hypothetical protein
MSTALPEPYDQGYRDGWHDICVTRRQRRARRRARSLEYALGYAHGREDGGSHPGYPDWYPDYARGPLTRPDLSRSSRGPSPSEPGDEPLWRVQCQNAA